MFKVQFFMVLLSLFDSPQQEVRGDALLEGHAGTVTKAVGRTLAEP